MLEPQRMDRVLVVGTKDAMENTINALHALGAIPIVNENDTISTDEIIRITFGDNDILAGLVAHATHADLLVLARRARYINVAISLCTISALLVALVVVTLFANALIGIELGGMIALLFVAALLVLSAAFVAFFIEVRTATAALRIGAPHI